MEAWSSLFSGYLGVRMDKFSSICQSLVPRQNWETDSIYPVQKNLTTHFVETSDRLLYGYS